MGVGRIHRRGRRCRLLAGLAAGLLGCGAPLALYEGPTRPEEEVAIVSAEGNSTMLQIDGKDIPRLETLFALEPGPHVLLFRVRLTHLNLGARGGIDRAAPAPQYTTHCFVTAELEAGHRYTLVAALWDAVRGTNPMGGYEFGAQHVTTVLGGVRDETTGRQLPDVRCDHHPLADQSY